VWISKVNEHIGSSPHSFEDAARCVVDRANETLRGITGVTVLGKRIKVRDDRITEYRVHVRLDFDMAPASQYHR
jgi:flavin-binding protein dodecin